jgi:hypothetical protein
MFLVVVEFSMVNGVIRRFDSKCRTVKWNAAAVFKTAWRCSKPACLYMIGADSREDSHACPGADPMFAGKCSYQSATLVSTTTCRACMLI